MSDLAFHTFLILFGCGLVGIVLGWFCRSVFEKMSQIQPINETPSRKVPARKTVKRKSGQKAKPKIKRKSAARTADDLKLISGVGRVLEKKLHKAGITRFAHIAAWKKADIDKFDKVLDFKGRISRENWVAQARKLSKKNS